MMLRHLRQLRHSPQLLHLRHYATSFLTIKSSEIAHAESLSHQYHKIPTIKTRVRVNQLLRAALSHDVVTSGKILKLFLAPLKLTSPNNINVYVSCLLILLKNITATKTPPQMLDFKPVVTDFVEFSRSFETTANKVRENISLSDLEVLKSTVEQCRHETIAALLVVHGAVPSKNDIYKRSIWLYIETTARDLGVTIENSRPNEPEQKHTSPSFSYTGLCDYILSTRFSEYDKGTPRPLYEVYKGLSSEEKDVFLDKYTLFNVERERIIEDNCTNLVSYTPNRLEANMGRFEQTVSHQTYQWYADVVAEFRIIAKSTVSEKSPKTSWNKDWTTLYKYSFHFSLLPKSVLANLVISDLLSSTLSSEKGHTSLLILCKQMQHRFARIVARTKHDATTKKFAELSSEDGAQFFAALVNVVMSKCCIEKSDIEKDFYLELLELFDAKVDTEFLEAHEGTYPAFLWGLESKDEVVKYKKTGVVRIHPYLMEKFKSTSKFFTNMSTYMPMLVPPKPWTSPVSGGYVQDLRPMVSHKFPEVSSYYFKSAHKTGQLNSVYAGLNTLGLVKWAINPHVYAVVAQAMQLKTGFLEIFPPVSEITVTFPAKPDQKDYDSESDYQSAVYAYRKERSARVREYHKQRSVRITLDLVLDLAKALHENGDMFYFPHMTDFRGRAYPMTSVLSHHNMDLVRSLLMFWEAKPLGKEGFNWLKYQLASVYGKSSFTREEKIRFVDENLDDIIDSATDPFGGRKFWQQADEPWQALALCYEIHSVQNFAANGGEIENYLSHTPVHQDGTCNGLQHYAALGADSEGARAVNLAKGGRSDIYVTVLDQVRKMVAKDQVLQVAQLSLAILNRKMVKQTIMTSVYGVTYYGAVKQVEARIKEYLRDEEIKKGPNYDSSNELFKLQPQVAGYIASKILQLLSSLFAGAKLLEDFLVESCFRVTSSFDPQVLQSKNRKFQKAKSYNPMMWTAPSGFPVIQLYKSASPGKVHTSLQRLSIRKPSEVAPVDMAKQLNAVAPNFIHSVDATHMLMTAHAARKEDMVFAAIHDSFWTHAGDVEKLSKIIRQEFVTLHSSGVVENLIEDLKVSVKSNLQLVFVKNAENQEFIAQVRNVRSQYAKNANQSLYKEVLEPEKIIGLYEKYKPTVYYRRKPGRGTVYDGKVRTPTLDINAKEFTPILVPVKMLDPPKKGTFDVKEVLDSEYFFL